MNISIPDNLIFLVLCANQRFLCRRAEAQRRGGREELGHSVKISLASHIKKSYINCKSNRVFKYKAV